VLSVDDYWGSRPLSEDEHLARLAEWAEAKLPEVYVRLLRDVRSREVFGDLVSIYPLDAVIERNETYETKKHCPGYLTIGDDSGGRAILIPLDDEACPVYVVDHGSMSVEDFSLVAAELTEWVRDGFRINDSAA
jgi:hypothetical protein